MEMDYVIHSSKTTPYIRISKADGKVELKGCSRVENATEFYAPVIEEMQKMTSLNKPVHMVCSLRYFNTSSAKSLFDVFKVLKEIDNSGNDVNINWYYEEDDDDMIETGEDYAELIGLDFKFHALSEEEFLSEFKKVS